MTCSHNHDPERYLRFMNDRYGCEVVAELDRLRRGGGKVADEELIKLLERLGGGDLAVGRSG